MDKLKVLKELNKELDKCANLLIAIAGDETRKCEAFELDGKIKGLQFAIDEIEKNL